MAKYHIVIFKDGGKGGSRKFHFRTWLAWLLFLFVLFLIVSNVWLGRTYLTHVHLQQQLATAEKRLDEQNVQLLSMLDNISQISRDVQRIERFDAQLRHMMQLDKELDVVGNTRREDLLHGSLPLHRPTLMARRMQTFLRQLAEDVRLEEVHQQDILRLLRSRKNNIMTTPSIWPVQGFVSSNFGMRRAPFGGARSFHKGIDIAARMGTPVLATADGTVKQSGHDGAYGIVVEINHGGGIVTKYAHMQRSSVKVGQWVRRGEPVGAVGMTGRTTGPHLHYEVVVGGVPKDPRTYILD